MTDAATSRRGGSTRGQHRRQLLLEAAAELITQRGFAAVSHRTVAQRAGLPLAATTYYFASLQDLLEQALGLLAGRWLARARTRLQQLPSRLTDPLQVAEAVLVVAVGTLGGDDDRDVLALYERYLEAARHPQLRPAVASYHHELDALLLQILHRAGPASPDPGTAGLLLAQVDGTVLRALAEGTPVAPAVQAAVTTLVRLLARPGSAA